MCRWASRQAAWTTARFCCSCVGGERVAAVRSHRHDVGGAVAEEDPGPRVGEHHHPLGEIAPGVVHALVGGGDVARRGEVVGPEVRPAAAPLAGFEERRQRRAAVGPEQRLRRLDHQLDPEGPGGQAVAGFEALAEADQRARLLGDGDLRQRDDEVVGEPSARRGEQRVDEDLQRARAARLPLGAERLDPDAEERRQQPLGETARHLARGGHGGRVLVGVGARAVAVLEVDAEVLDRLAPQLGEHALVHREGEPGLRALPPQSRRVALEGGAQRRGVGRARRRRTSPRARSRRRGRAPRRRARSGPSGGARARPTGAWSRPCRGGRRRRRCGSAAGPADRPGRGAPRRGSPARALRGAARNRRGCRGSSRWTPQLPR